LLLELISGNKNSLSLTYSIRANYEKAMQIAGG